MKQLSVTILSAFDNANLLEDGAYFADKGTLRLTGGADVALLNEGVFYNGEKSEWVKFIWKAVVKDKKYLKVNFVADAAGIAVDTTSGTLK